MNERSGPALMGGHPDPGFGVYIHWPFCAAKCPYCDFNSHVRQGGDGVDEAQFLEAYKRELAVMAALTPGRTVRSIFFGGGTPSLMSGSVVGALLEAVGARWDVMRDAEVTLEANPSSVEAGRFADYAAAGVNRVSIGVQSLVDEDLKRLGRLHDKNQALQALDVAHRHFNRVSFDMIYARPAQSVAAWQAELDEALAFAAGHLSLYQLTIEPGTTYAALHAAGNLVVPDELDALAFYEMSQEVCEKHGLYAYEVSNHARAGEESRHNLIYWRYGDYAGVGPGAHSRITHRGERLALSSVRHPETWRDQVLSKGDGIETRELLDRGAQAKEMLLMGLRLSEGVSLKRMRNLTGYQLDSDEIDGLVDDGLVEFVGGERTGLRTTNQGRHVLNTLIGHLADCLEDMVEA